MAEISDKLQRRLAAIKEAGGTLPWLEAPKQHRQLEEAGLVKKGRIGAEEYAVLTDIVEGDP